MSETTIHPSSSKRECKIARLSRKADHSSQPSYVTAIFAAPHFHRLSSPPPPEFTPLPPFFCSHVHIRSHRPLPSFAHTRVTQGKPFTKNIEFHLLLNHFPPPPGDPVGPGLITLTSMADEDLLAIAPSRYITVIGYKRHEAKQVAAIHSVDIGGSITYIPSALGTTTVTFTAALTLTDAKSIIKDAFSPTEVSVGETSESGGFSTSARDDVIMAAFSPTEASARETGGSWRSGYSRSGDSTSAFGPLCTSGTTGFRRISRRPTLSLEKEGSFVLAHLLSSIKSVYSHLALPLGKKGGESD